MRARCYNPNICRFVNIDPIRDGVNWYGYCSGNSINYIDPLGKYKKGDENLPDLIQKLINGPNKDGNGGLSLSWKLAKDDEARELAELFADKLREYFNNEINIDRIVILLDSEGADGFGHVGTLLISNDNKGIFLSYAGINGKPIYTTGAMMLGVMDIDNEITPNYVTNFGWADFVYRNEAIKVIASSGDTSFQYFNNSICLTLSYNDGLNALKKIVELYNSPGKYSYLFHNCDDVVSQIVQAANKYYVSQTIPNLSFSDAYLYYYNHKLWLLNECLSYIG